jgi:predicted  nucleic acid-binding Zn-ribbon protein
VHRRRDELAREEQRLDDEAQSLQARATDVEKKMYSGEISSPRELQAMQADVEQLRRHQRALENSELELMEQREPVDAGLAQLEDRGAALEDELNALRATIAGAEQEIDAEASVERTARDALTSALDPVLVAEYERRRARSGGTGAARLIGNTCQGCHLTIPSIEAERVKRAPAGTVAHCDNCGCILVP